MLCIKTNMFYKLISNKLFTALAISSIFVSCNGNLGAKDQTETKNSQEEEREILCGGFTGQRDLTAEDLEIFRSALGPAADTLFPISVATQVVAGLNYRFVCNAPSGQKTVTVYQDLQGGLSILDR